MSIFRSFFWFLFSLCCLGGETPEFTTLVNLAREYDAFLLDAHGVFWGSYEVGLLPGASDAMGYLVSQGKQVGILSNTTQSARSSQKKLQKSGLIEGVHYHFFLTSGEVARGMLLQDKLPFPTPRRTYALFGAPHPRYSSKQIFSETGYREMEQWEEADFIYISTPHIGGEDQTRVDGFREQVAAVPTTLPVFCANPDCFALEGVPERRVVRQGSIARLFEEKGASVFYVGKPSSAIFQAALDRFPKYLSTEKIIMIGDTPSTDIRGAHEMGLSAALVTQTGVLAEEIEAKGVETVLSGLEPSDQPDFLIERFSVKDRE